MEDEDDFAISHVTPPETIEKRKVVRNLTGCSYSQAMFALIDNNNDVVAAVDSLLSKPVCKGDTYLPPKPKINTGLSDEQKALCERGRWLQSKVNEVISVAHSQIRNQPDPLVAPNEELPVEVRLPTLQQEESQLMTELQPDSHAKTTLQVEQSESPL